MNCFCKYSDRPVANPKIVRCAECLFGFHLSCLADSFELSPDSTSEPKLDFLCLRCKTAKFSFHHKTVELLSVPLLVSPRDTSFELSLDFKLPFKDFADALSKPPSQTAGNVSPVDGQAQTPPSAKIRLFLLSNHPGYQSRDFKINADKPSPVQTVAECAAPADTPDFVVNYSGRFGRGMTNSFGAVTLWSGDSLDECSGFRFPVEEEPVLRGMFDQRLKLSFECKRADLRAWAMVAFQVRVCPSRVLPVALKHLAMRNSSKTDRYERRLLEMLDVGLRFKYQAQLTQESVGKLLMFKYRFFINNWAMHFSLTHKIKVSEFSKRFKDKFFRSSQLLYRLLLEFCPKFGRSIRSIDDSHAGLLRACRPETRPESWGSLDEFYQDFAPLVDHLSLGVKKAPVSIENLKSANSAELIRTPFWCMHCCNLRPADFEKLLVAQSRRCQFCQKELHFGSILLKPHIALVLKKYQLLDQKLDYFVKNWHKNVLYEQMRVPIEPGKFWQDSEYVAGFLKSRRKQSCPQESPFASTEYTQLEKCVSDFRLLVIDQYNQRNDLTLHTLPVQATEMFRMLRRVSQACSRVSGGTLMTFYLNFDIIPPTNSLFDFLAKGTGGAVGNPGTSFSQEIKHKRATATPQKMRFQTKSARFTPNRSFHYKAQNPHHQKNFWKNRNNSFVNFRNQGGPG